MRLRRSRLSGRKFGPRRGSRRPAHLHIKSPHNHTAVSARDEAPGAHRHLKSMQHQQWGSACHSRSPHTAHAYLQVIIAIHDPAPAGGSRLFDHKAETCSLQGNIVAFPCHRRSFPVCDLRLAGSLNTSPYWRFWPSPPLFSTPVLPCPALQMHEMRCQSVSSLPPPPAREFPETKPISPL